MQGICLPSPGNHKSLPSPLTPLLSPFYLFFLSPLLAPLFLSFQELLLLYSVPLGLLYFHRSCNLSLSAVSISPSICSSLPSVHVIFFSHPVSPTLPHYSCSAHSYRFPLVYPPNSSLMCVSSADCFWLLLSVCPCSLGAASRAGWPCLGEKNRAWDQQDSPLLQPCPAGRGGGCPLREQGETPSVCAACSGWSCPESPSELQRGCHFNV